MSALTLIGVVATAGGALADNIQDDIVVGGNDTITVGGSTTVKYRISATGQGTDGQNGCNAADNTPATVKINTPAGVTATPSSLTFTTCGTDQPVSISSATAGSYPITVSVTDSGVGTYTTDQAQFTLKVNAPANTPPQVAVTGVSNGASYAKSAVPQPGCSVVDAEDTHESATPVVTGGAYNDLGSHTVTCSYTDGGGLSRSASASYTVVRDKDTTAPVISYELTPETPDGANGWYRGAVALQWTVTESESPETLKTTGCENQSITADQAATTYSCSATSEGGSAAQQSVTVKRDGTAPKPAYDGVVSGTVGNNGWYISPVTVKFTATDALSGPASASTNVDILGDGSGLSVSSPEFSDAAGNKSAIGAVSSDKFNIDTKAPNAPTVSVDPAPNGAGWSNGDVMVSFAPNGDNGPSGVDSCTADVTVDVETASKTVSGTCVDAAGNESAAKTVMVKLDKTRPVISQTVTVSGSQGANDWYTSDVEVTFSASDLLSGLAVATQEVKSSGEGSAVEVTSPVFTDRADNSTTGADEVVKTFKIDKAAPTNVAFAGVKDYYFGDEQTKPTCTADDATSGVASCVVTGGGAGVGTQTWTATATDFAGHTATKTATYQVLNWTTKGFYSPVDMAGVLNTVKGGSTVPLKFELFSGSTELTAVSAVKSFSAQKVNCTTGTSGEDAIEEFATTGGTSLRYDTTGGQFIQNWKTPTGAGTCYKATMTAQDGSSLSALFKLK